MIELTDFKRQWTEIQSDVLGAVERVGRSGRYILGSEVARFEAELAKLCGLAHAIGVGNGMDAIEIALRALALREGERVLTTPFSAFATTLAIVRAGGVPVYVDVDDSGNIDLEQCRHALKREPAIRFFVPVHLYGNPLDLEELARLKRDFAVNLVEDCAQAIGARFDARAVGTVGDAAAISFYPTKNLGALGDAGAILTHDPALAERARALRNYGQTSQYLHEQRGLNSRLDELHAAILHDAFLPRLESWTRARRAIAARYRRAFEGSSRRLLAIDASADPVWHLFPVFTTERQEFRSQLEERGIQTAVHYPRIIPDQPAMQDITFEVVAEPRNARTLAATEVSLPLHPFLAEAEADEVIRACVEFAEAMLQPAK
jgi:dTDP-3-amino-3,4,6-trideoxy-alpha-D-glucose transaminase